MKNLIFLAIALGFPLANFAQQKAAFPTSKTTLHANRLRVSEIVPGAIVWPNLPSSNDLDYGRPPVSVDFDGSPKPSAGFSAAGLWLGGLDTAGQIRVSCASYYYYNEKYPFVAGPLSGDWPTDSLNAVRWDRFFKVSRIALETHRADWADNGILDNPLPAIVGWPGRGNPHFENQYGFQLPDGELAPFVDVNGDGVYNAFDGDYPHPPSLAPDILPGEIIWNIFNDAYGNFLGVPLGVEVQSTAWALACDGDNLLNETVFLSYQITNRSGMDLDSVVAGVYMSRLLGTSYFDDAWGTYPSGNSVFIYNSDNIDSTIHPASEKLSYFGINPPAASLTSLNRNLTKSIYFIDGGTCDPAPGMSAPNNAIQYFRYLNGYWKDGTPLVYGGSGYNSNPNGGPTDFAYPDDPNDTTGWSIWDTYQSIWASCIKILPSIRLGFLPRDSTVILETVFSYHRGPGLNNLENVTYCYDRVGQLQQLYDAKFAGACTYEVCLDDCVWPGDFDRDGIVSLRDVLPLGVGWGSEGPTRSGPVTWSPHTAADWEISFDNLYDFKHLDANGDGTMDALDLKVMQVFDGLHVPDYIAAADTYVAGDGLWLSQNNSSTNPDNVLPNDAVSIRVRVADALGLYGVAFEAEFDTAYWKLNTVGSISVSPGIPLKKQKIGGIEIAAVFTDTASGFVSNQHLITFIIRAKAIPDSLPDTTFIRIKNIRSIRADGSEIPMSANKLRYCFGGGCPDYVGTEEKMPPAEIQVFPNPTSGTITLLAAALDWQHIETFDINGRLLRRWDEPDSELAELDLGGLSPGWVQLRVTGRDWMSQQRVLLLR